MKTASEENEPNYPEIERLEDKDTVIYRNMLFFIGRQFDVLEKIADVYGTTIRTYINNAVLDIMEQDLDNYHELGRAFCHKLKIKAQFEHGKKGMFFRRRELNWQQQQQQEQKKKIS